MRYLLEDVQAGDLPVEMKRRGIASNRRVRVVVDTLDDELPLARIAQDGGAFDFLACEPDLYSEADIRAS